MKVNWLFLAIAFVFLLPVSCNRAPDKVLSQRQMIAFIADLHKLDGALSVKGLTTIDDRENIYFYNALLARHNITKELFDSSLVWYTRHPKKFNRIYKEVLSTINKEDSILRDIKRMYDDSVAMADKTIDIWTKPRTFTFTKDSAVKYIDFNISGYEFFTGDLFELKFLHRSSPVDSTFAEQAVLRIHYENDFTDSISATLYADSILRRYTLRFKTRHEFRVKHISGVVSNLEKPEKRIRTVVDSLYLQYSYSPPLQNAMRQKWQNDTVKTDTIKRIKQKLPHIPNKNRLSEISK